MLKNRISLVKLFPRLKVKVGVELGVARGDYSYKLNKAYTFEKFYGVDSWSSRIHNDSQRLTATQLLGRFPQVELIQGTFSEVVTKFEDNYFDLVVTSEDAGGDKVSGFPEKLLARLLDDSNPVGWSIGDQDWDHLFSGSTDFFQKVSHSKSTTYSEGKKKFHTFNQMIEILQEAEKR